MKKIYGLAFATALMALASCSSDDAPEVKNPDVIDGPVVGYVKMNLPAGTRADANTYVHFTKGGTPVTCVATENEGEYAVSAIPDKVVVFRGADFTYPYNAETTDTDILTPAVFGDGTYGSPVSAANIYNVKGTPGDAPAVVVYLDHVYADVTVTAATATSTITSKLIDYSVEFDPEYVFVNGVAQKTPIIKTVVPDWNCGYGPEDSEDGESKGSHWTSTSWDWTKTDEVTHYKLSEITIGKKQENKKIFERVGKSDASLKKDYTHIIVAGKYILTDKAGKKLVANDNWDGTFYVYGADENGNGHVYLSEAAVLADMNGNYENGDRLTLAKSEGAGMNTHMTFGGKTCLKYDQGYVYYAEPIVTKIGEKNYGKGVVRNHQYKINVSQINGWGIAIPNIDEPIIPEDQDKDADKSYLMLDIKINAFETVAGQDVKW
ncbi:MAG: fimbria major subunit [Muribaculaceae bacterium]|nr:fimbria major subunit [Muribaculaceae bacterium]